MIENYKIIKKYIFFTILPYGVELAIIMANSSNLISIK